MSRPLNEVMKDLAGKSIPVYVQVVGAALLLTALSQIGIFSGLSIFATVFAVASLALLIPITGWIYHQIDYNLWSFERAIRRGEKLQKGRYGDENLDGWNLAFGTENKVVGYDHSMLGYVPGMLMFGIMAFAAIATGVFADAPAALEIISWSLGLVLGSASAVLFIYGCFGSFFRQFGRLVSLSKEAVESASSAVKGRTSADSSEIS